MLARTTPVQDTNTRALAIAVRHSEIIRYADRLQRQAEAGGTSTIAALALLVRITRGTERAHRLNGEMVEADRDRLAGLLFADRLVSATRDTVQDEPIPYRLVEDLA